MFHNSPHIAFNFLFSIHDFFVGCDSNNIVVREIIKIVDHNEFRLVQKIFETAFSRHPRCRVQKNHIVLQLFRKVLDAFNPLVPRFHGIGISRIHVVKFVIIICQMGVFAEPFVVRFQRNQFSVGPFNKLAYHVCASISASAFQYISRCVLDDFP